MIRTIWSKCSVFVAENQILRLFFHVRNYIVLFWFSGVTDHSYEAVSRKDITVSRNHFVTNNEIFFLSFVQNDLELIHLKKFFGTFQCIYRMKKLNLQCIRTPQKTLLPNKYNWYLSYVLLSVDFKAKDKFNNKKIFGS